MTLLKSPSTQGHGRFRNTFFLLESCCLAPGSFDGSVEPSTGVMVDLLMYTTNHWKFLDRGFIRGACRHPKNSKKAENIQLLASRNKIYGEPNSHAETFNNLYDDRPLAILGVATKYSRLIESSYFAGLWEINLTSGILWRRPEFFKYTTLQPQPRGRALTWSWTSMNGDVELADVKLEKTTGVKLSILEYRIELVTPSAPFGAVQSALLKVRGCLRRAWYNHSRRERIWFFPWNSDVRPSSAYISASATWDNLSEDADHEMSNTTSIWCLEVLHSLAEDDDGDFSYHGGGLIPRPAGLLLAQDHDQEPFLRFGYFDFGWRKSDASLCDELSSTEYQEMRDLFLCRVFEEFPQQTITIA